MFQILPEGQVQWIPENDFIKVIPVPKDPIAAFKGRGRGKYSTENLMQERKRERQLENKKDRKNK